MRDLFLMTAASLRASLPTPSRQNEEFDAEPL
jgi:hypothetical protein